MSLFIKILNMEQEKYGRSVACRLKSETAWKVAIEAKALGMTTSSFLSIIVEKAMADFERDSIPVPPREPLPVQEEKKSDMSTIIKQLKMAK